MSPQEPNPSLHDCLLSSWKHDQEHFRDAHYPSLPPRVLCYSSGPVGFAARQDNQSRIRQQLLEDCEQYVLNYLPTHLLRISDMTLVTRAEFWEAERPRVKRELREYDVQKFAQSKRCSGSSNFSRNSWHSRTRRDDTVDINRDTYIRSLFKFAILSHRWGDDEPQFSNVLDKGFIEEPTIGYEKLLKFCQRATDYDCCYVWSDTCCINKESSVELDEAIRSMYRWYSIATVCIVHLAKSLTIEDFPSEPWFRRGWTLQELLAPQVIKFYGKDWEPICREVNGSEKAGDKAIKEVWGAIEVVTGIPHDDLWHFVPSCDRIAEKMTWASQRKTTKIEDTAYSLLGLFNVSLPIAYGEADRAWYRLMSVIANECTDASFFAWAGQPSPYSRALPSSPTSYLKLVPRTPVSLFNRRHPTYEVTKLGVVIKILVIPARCNVLEDDDGRDIGYTVTPHDLEPFLVGANVPHGRVEEYKLGIVNFRSRGDLALVEVEDECHCLVLAKVHSDEQGWTMVNTECVIVVRCLEEICKSPETVLLYHTSGYDSAFLRHAHRYNPVIENFDRLQWKKETPALVFVPFLRRLQCCTVSSTGSRRQRLFGSWDCGYVQDSSMDSAKNILHSILLAIQQVRHTTTQYSITRGVRRVRQHSLIRLESEFQTIANTVRAVLEVLDDPLLSQHYMLDDRLVDWLSGTEPETCLDALREMGELLSVEREVQGFPGFTPMRSVCEEDNVHAAIALFHVYKAHFHFLLTTGIWNNGNAIYRQAQAHSDTDIIHLQGHVPPQSNPVEDIAIENQRKEIVSQKLNKILKLLDPLDCSGRHREASTIRQSDTCMWLLATDAYRSWREGRVSFLWLQGKAGAGKSVLASFVINDLSDTNDGELLIYIYCDFRMKRSTSAVEVMRSILAQLITRLYVLMINPEGLLDRLLKDIESRADPFYSVKGLSHYLSKVAKLFPRKPLVVIDALDECREVESLLDGLTMSAGDLRVFVTCRPLQGIVNILSIFPCILMDKMAKEVSADILLHVTRELDSRHRLRTFNDGLKQEMQLKLCAKADGMFRWVQCQLDTLEKCSSVSEIRAVLESLPEGLEETYRRILIAIDRGFSDARLARRALVWLVAALRPMCMRELLEGIMIDPEYRALDSRFKLMKGADLLDVCRSLVVHHEETDIITLSHMSVKEYLVGELIYDRLPRYHIVLEDAHERLARLCMAYIAFCLDEIKESRERSSVPTRERDLRLTTSYASRPLLKYVLSDGFNHLAHLGVDNARILKDIGVLQVTTCRYAWEWDRMCKLVPSIHTGVPWPTSEHDFTFYILIAFASDSLFQVFLRHNPPNPRVGTNPLVYAAHFAKTDYARLLISRGADVNHRGLVVEGPSGNCSDTDSIGGGGSDEDSDHSDECNDDRSAIPLEVAVYNWHTQMVDLLLAERSAVPARLLTRVLREQPYDFPLYIIRRLMQTAEFTKWVTTTRDNQRLLEALVDDEEDHEELELVPIVRKLVQVGCAETLLLAAVGKGCVPVIRTLFSVDTRSSLSSALDPNDIVGALTTNGDTPFHIAMRLFDESRCLVITKLLVMGGCNPLQFDADDKPPVYIAVARGLVSVVDYLLSRDVPLPQRILFTALQVTPLKRVMMVRLLISKGANVHVLSSGGDTLLHAIMRSFDRSVCLEIAEILIDAGCNPSTHNPHDETALHIAAKQGYYEVVNYLLLFSTFPDVLSLLHPKDQASAMRLLIGNMYVSRFEPDDEDRAVQAIRQFLDDQDKCLELVGLFIDTASNLFAQSLGSAMVFEIATIREFTLVVEYLISEAIPLPSRILFTALRHQPRMVPFLLSKGADLHSQEDSGDSLLHVAISTLLGTQCCEIVELLAGAGCPISMVNATGVQPIQVAVSRGFISVVKYLLSHLSHAGMPLPPDLLFIALQSYRPLSMICLLMDNGADVFYRAPDGDDMLHVALNSWLTEDECLQVMQMLVKAGCSPCTLDASGSTLLHIAIRKGYSVMADYLLSLYVPLPSDILSCILQSQFDLSLRSKHDWTLLLTSLIRRGANLHTRDADGNTLMHYAMKLRSESPCLEATKILVNAGCSSSIPNCEGELPIQMAVGRALTTVVEYLLSQSSMFPPDILFTALEYQTAFHKEVLTMVTSLVSRGADVRVLAPNGDTALHVALAHERWWLKNDHSCLLDVVKILVEAGCDTSARDANGCTPFEVAMATGYLEVAEYLRSLNAKALNN